MNFSLFLLPLLTSFVLAVLVLIAMILWGKKMMLVDERVESRHIHQKGISRFGGVALIVAFIVSVLLDKNLVIDLPLFGLLVASMAILFFGVIDDLKQLSWRSQLFFQVVLVLFMYFMGAKLQFVSNPFGGIFLFQGVTGAFLCIAISVVWVVFLMNAINWVDGIDGVAGGITFISGLSILFLSLRPEVNQPPISIITAILLGSLAAFLLLNFHPAKIIAGTSGSMFMGFILAILAIFAGAKIATTLLVLAVPIIDALWVIGQRFKSGVSIFSGDRRHLHFRLLELGWSKGNICFFYYAVTALVSFVALNTRALGKLTAIFVVALIMLVILVVISKKTEPRNVNSAQ